MHQRLHRGRGLRVMALAGLVLLGVTAMTTAQAGPAGQDTAATSDAAKLRSQLGDVEAKVAAARERHAALQSQLDQLEQQSSDRRQQLQQRDATIAALQKQLATAAPVSATSTQH